MKISDMTEAEIDRRLAEALYGGFENATNKLLEDGEDGLEEMPLEEKISLLKEIRARDMEKRIERLLS